MGPNGIQSSWIGPGIPGMRDSDSTYCIVPLESLPPVDVPDDLSWLSPLHPRIAKEMEIYLPNDDVRQSNAMNARSLLSEALRLELDLPKAFTELIQSEEMQDRFPSATACTFEWPARFMSSPFGQGHIMPFLYDQQAVVVWYLHIAPNETPCVLAAFPLEVADEILFLGDLENHPEQLTQARAHTRFVAQSLPEFLYRTWIENSLFFKQDMALGLSPEEEAYAADL